jgi:hypothetical protein
VLAGRRLQEIEWSWDTDASEARNHQGSKALVAATRDMPFDRLIARLAPWLLLAAARERGGQDDEIALAGNLISIAMEGGPERASDLGADASIDVLEEDASSFAISFRLREDPQSKENSPFWRETSLDFETRRKQGQSIAKTAWERIRATHLDGAEIYFRRMNTSDLRLLIDQDPPILARWLDGMEESSAAFVRRVGLAEGLYLCLCEALLESYPSKGAQLWRSLRGALTTHWVGKAKIEELIHIAFRAPASDASDNIMRELFEVRNAHTDLRLFELVLAAFINGRSEFVGALIREDRMAGIPWRQRRADLLAGFMGGNELPVEGAWPEGFALGGKGRLRQDAAERQHREACSRHWWKEYQQPQNPEQAYAAWVLFLRSADRRAWAWLEKVGKEEGRNNLFNEEKHRFMRLNEHVLERALERREEKLDGHFLGLKIGEKIWPWACADG